MEIRTQDGQVMYESEFRKLYPNTSFPQIINAETLNEFGATVVLEGPQANPTRYQIAFRDGVEQIDGQWFTKYSVADIDDEAKTAKDAEQAKSIRAMRDEKLKATDWTQVADAPVDKTAWATYRQALRDLTKESGFPWDVTFPTEPGATT
jgi:Phage tail assembly chaperone protein